MCFGSEYQTGLVYQYQTGLACQYQTGLACQHQTRLVCRTGLEFEICRCLLVIRAGGKRNEKVHKKEGKEKY